MIGPIRARWLAATLCTLLSGCGPFFGDLADRRAAYAKAAKGPIVVAVVDDRPGHGYLDGIRLGVEQINASTDRLLGRPIELLVRRGSNDIEKMLPRIRAIAANPTVTAVLGHRTSAVAVPASITYEKTRVLFMSPFATSRRLTLHGFDFTLRMLPDNKAQAGQIASLAALFGYQRIAVLHSRSDYARAVAFLFEDAARRFDMDISFRSSFFAASDNYRELIGDLKGVDFDAIFLSTEIQSGARMLRQLRELGINKPVLGSDALGAGPLAELAGEGADLTIVPTVYSPETTNEAKRRFIDDFNETYDKEPNQDAAQGYDSIKVLAEMVERTGTTEARALSTTAHFSAPIAGVTGIYAYDPDGNIYGKSFRFKVMRFGRWWPLPGVTVPYLMARFQEQSLAQVQNGTQTPSPPGADAQKPPAAAEAPYPDTAMAPTVALANQAPPDSQAGAKDAAEASTPGDGSGLGALTRGFGGTIERDMAWLGLAHEILGFDRVGLVVSSTMAENVAAVALARSVGRDRGFDVEVCELQGSKPEVESSGQLEPSVASQAKDVKGVMGERLTLRKAGLRCYSRLARTVDSVFVVTDSGLSPSYLRELNRALLRFGVSTFAMQDNIAHDYGLTLALVSSGLDLRDPDVALRFNGLLNGIRVHELNDKISDLPSVAADIGAVQSLGLFRDPRQLTLISGVLNSSPIPTDMLTAEEPN